MAIEYRHSHGLANLTIASWFDSNDACPINATEFDMHCPMVDTQEN